MEVVVVMRWYAVGVIFLVSGFFFLLLLDSAAFLVLVMVIFWVLLLHSDFGDARDVAHGLACMVIICVLLW